MWKWILLTAGLLVKLALLAQTVVIPDVWINEIHYNNIGTDTLNGFEIAGPTGTNLGCYEVFLYDGSAGLAYLTDTLSGTIPAQMNGYGTVWFGLAQGAMQNVTNGGFVLVYAPQATACGLDNVDTILQFLSFGGAFTAANGRAQGVTSTDIGVSENNTTAEGTSLQLTGSGDKYSDFSWLPSGANTYGAPNTGQTFADPILTFILSGSVSVSEGADSLDLAIAIANPNSTATSVDVNVVPGGTAYNGTNYTYSPVTVTFPANSPFTQTLHITLFDDSIADADKFFTFQLAYPSNHGIVGSNGSLTVNILNDDTCRISITPTSDTVPKTAGTVYVPVNINLTSDSDISVQVVVVSAGTTAVQGTDFLFNDTTITWPAGTRGVINVPITVLNDTLLEPNKVVVLGLVNPTNGALLNNLLDTLLILEHDTTYIATIRFLTLSDTVAAPQADTQLTVVVQVINPTGGPIVFAASVDGSASTAIEGNSVPADYHYSNDIFTNTADTTYDTLALFFVFPTSQVSPPKTVVLILTNLPDNAVAINDSVHTIYITNNNIFTVSFLGAGFAYSKDTPLVEVKATINALNPTPVTVNVTQAPGSAIYGVDYTFDDTTITFPAYSMDTQGVWVHILPNNIYQPNKQINLNLSNPTGGPVLGITGYTIIIINDDSLASGFNSPQAPKGVTVFPNPATQFLFIQAEDELSAVQISDILGRKLMNLNKLPAGRNSLEISSLPAGIYNLNAENKNGHLSMRFTKTE